MTGPDNSRTAQKLTAAYAARLADIDETSLAPLPDATTLSRSAATAIPRWWRTRRVLPVLAAACVAIVVAVAVAMTRSDRGSPGPVGTRPPTAVPTSVVPSTSSTPSPPRTTTPTATHARSSTAARSTHPNLSPAVVGAGPWSEGLLVITGDSLGGVRLGMTSAAAARAAGVPAFVAVGDGVLEPSNQVASADPGLYLGNFAGRPASSIGGSFSCVGATLRGTRPSRTVTTSQGLRLGDPGARVHEIYGGTAEFVPAPSTGGIDPHAGYVVHQGSDDLVIKLDPTNSRVIGLAGGLAPMTPSECTG